MIHISKNHEDHNLLTLKCARFEGLSQVVKSMFSSQGLELCHSSQLGNISSQFFT